MHVLAGEIVGVLAHIERADQHGAGGFEPPDDRRIAFAGGASRLILEPASVVSPAISNRFLTANGTPARGPSGSRGRASSMARARARARSSVTAVKALNCGPRSRMRASAAATMLAAVLRPAATAAAISAAVLHATSMAFASCMEHRGGLGVVGQWELVHPPCHHQ